MHSTNSTWLMLIEKAFAKAYGSYLCLRGGFAHQGLLDLTGKPTFTYDFMSYAVAGKLDSGQFWPMIDAHLACRFLLVASTFDEECPVEPSFPKGEKHIDNLGLLKAHAYSLIRVLSIKNGGQLERVLLLRNPYKGVELSNNRTFSFAS
jgi:calpain-15